MSLSYRNSPSNPPNLAAPQLGANSALLQVRSLTKSFGRVPALIDINLDVRAGEKVVLLGASGSGKSTLLRCLNWLEVPDTGTVMLDGRYLGRVPDGKGQWRLESPAELAAKRRQIGMVFQSFNLFAHLRVLDNIAIGPRKVLKRPKGVCRELAHALLERVHLSHHANKYPWQLSGGEQQRVAIARALAMNPKLMLFDEPTSALDPALTHDVMQVIQALAAEGMTMVVVTHEVRFAQQAADTVVFMEHGNLIEQGRPADFFHHPQTEAAQRFLSYVL
ncbi:MAG: amino acid ABC transporter ATP-binding protein [Cyanobacteria bacterium J06642_9]